MTTVASSFSMVSLSISFISLSVGAEREVGLFLLVARKDPPGVPRDFFLRTLDIVNVNGVALLVLV